MRMRMALGWSLLGAVGAFVGLGGVVLDSMEAVIELLVIEVAGVVVPSLWLRTRGAYACNMCARSREKKVLWTGC